MSRHRTSSTGVPAKLAAAAAAAVVLLSVSACGEDTGDGSEATPAVSSGGFDVSSATLTDEAFCDDVDTATVADVLGMPVSSVKVVIDRRVGQEFEGPNEEAPPKKSVANLCSFGSGTKQFLVSVQPDATAEDVQQSIDELSALKGGDSSETCEPVDASDFGDPAGAFSCTSGAPLERARVVATGLVGDSKFYCAAMVNEDPDPGLKDATLDACRSTMENLAESA